MSESNPRKRRRPALSCEQCRRRKVRCDREMPCGPCSKSHLPLACEYVNEGKIALNARLDVPHGNDETGPSSMDATQIAELKCTVHALQGRLHSLEQAVQVTGTPGLGPEIQDDVGLKEPRQPAHVPDDRLAQQGRQASGRLPDQPQTLIAPLPPRLKGSGETTRLFGTTHWAMVFQQVGLSLKFSYQHF